MVESLKHLLYASMMKEIREQSPLDTQAELVMLNSFNTLNLCMPHSEQSVEFGV